MAEKIHCDLIEVYGPNWASLTSTEVECLVNAIHSAKELLGNEPELYGFVGTQQIGNIVGGYFAIQYEDEEYHYTKDKELNITVNYPFARIFFVFFAQSGKLLLQNTKFVGIPLTMEIAHDKFQSALGSALAGCGIGEISQIVIVPEETEDVEFVKEFERSTRVVRIKVEVPLTHDIPEDFVYYNPQIDRNAIIRESHRHDYRHLKKVDLEAADDDDLKHVHLRDLIYTSKPKEMQYYIGKEKFTLRKEMRRKFEFYIDMDAEELSKDSLYAVMEMLRKERATFLETPTPKSPPPNRLDGQLSLFDDN